MQNRHLALVTGGNRGIGLETAKALARNGLAILIGSRNLDDGLEAVRQLEGDGHGAVELDVTNSDQVQRAVAEADSRGGLDVLVNNAAIYLTPPAGKGDRTALTTELAVAHRTFEVNVWAPLRLCQLVMPGMVERGYGRVVNVSSGYGAYAAQDGGGPSAYRLSKLALNGLTRQLAAEAGSGVLVNAVDPGWVQTRMGGSGASRAPETAGAEIAWAAMLPDGGPSGQFFFAREPRAW
ncbi:MAG: SDR family NAD(P)-dependent oxidoreductase [Bacteroidota bacterium]